MGTSTFGIFARALLQLKLKEPDNALLNLHLSHRERNILDKIQLLGINQLTEEQRLTGKPETLKLATIAGDRTVGRA